jgi:arylsulfatase
MADDLGYSDIGCFGGEIATPVLDQLAEQGVRFTNFYNAARCCPSRASLLTGHYPHAVGMGRMVTELHQELPAPGPYQGYLNQEPTIAEMLKQAGYRTYMSGKWHVGERPEHWPRKRGFDRYFGLTGGASSYFELVKESRKRTILLDDEPWPVPETGFYMTDATTDFALEFLKNHHGQTPDQPFFLYLAYTAPHWPLHAPEEETAKYLGKYADGWDAVRENRYQRMKELGIINDRHVFSPRPASIPEWENVANKETEDRKMAVYAAMVDRMDQGIGKLVNYLKETGELDHTLIVFISNNGGCAENIEGRRLHDPSRPVGARGSYVAYDEPWANVSNTPYRRYKQYIHEGGILTPAIVYWPEGIKEKGSLVHNPAHIIDLVPTALELAGTTPGKPLPGISLLHSIARKDQEERTFYWEHFGNKGIRKGNWKLVMERGIGEWELYDLEKDPTELQNLITQEPEMKDLLEKLWGDWAEAQCV